MLLVSLSYLFIFMMLLLILVGFNSSFWICSLKVFFLGFFGDFELLFNIWSLLFLFLVIFISMSVMLFSFSYMSALLVTNFILLYFSFVISMMWLILNTNFYWMMFGWDGLGVVSFLLIIFYMNYESISNGFFTLFQNRFGDLFFILFMLGSINLSISMNLIIYWGSVILIFGAIVKSAQFPFNSWLLSAMSAPTPISSLVHSSTLVVAGVYILLQYSYCLSENLLVLKYLSFMSLIYSSLGLLLEKDMKKLIAFSTMSHVSLMMYLLSYQLYKIVYFHLNIHAMSKSLMFMCFGFVMLISYHGQDERLVSLNNINPLVKVIFYFSCLCLAGLPFLSAFFSKDFIIEKCMEVESEFFFIFSLLLFLSVSVYYSLKLMSLVHYFCSYGLIEKTFLGLGSLLLMSSLMIILINVYLSLVFSISLEFFSYKVFIYSLMLMMGGISILFKLKWKFMSYSKLSFFKELWLWNYFSLDSYMYYNMYIILKSLSWMSSMKFILMMNWWILFFFIVIF